MDSRRVGRAAALLGIAVTAVCLAYVHATRSDAFWTGDCANKALVAARLVETRYRSPDFDDPAAAIDPGRVAYPLPALAIPRDGGLVSVFPLAYPALAAPFLAVLGPAGLRWPAAIGTGACAALFAVWLAPAVGRRLALASGAALGLATPLFFYGVTVWEHSLTLALVLAASIAVSRTGRAAALAAGLAVGAACWLREELLLFGVALVLDALLRQRDPRRALAVACGGAVPGLALAGFNAALYGSVLGPHAAALNPELPGGGTASAAVHVARFALLVVGRGGGPGEAIPLAALALAAVALPGVAMWRSHRNRGPGREPAGRGVAAAVVVAAAAGAGLWTLGVVRVASGPPLVGLATQNGFLVQVPLVCLAGAGLLPLFRREEAVPLRSGVSAGLGFLALATIAGLGIQGVFEMGLHFGPRKLLPALPALVALSAFAVSGASGLPRLARTAVRVAAVLLLCAGVGSSLLAAHLLRHQKAEGAALQDALRARPEPYVVTGDAMLSQALMGIWHDKPLLFTPGPREMRAVVEAMRARGVRHFLVLVSHLTPISDPALRLHCRRLPPHRGGVVGYWDTDLQRCTLR